MSFAGNVKLAYRTAHSYSAHLPFLAIQMCGCRRRRHRPCDCWLSVALLCGRVATAVLIYRFVSFFCLFTFVVLHLLCSTSFVDILTPALSLVPRYASFVTLSTATKYPIIPLNGNSFSVRATCTYPQRQPGVGGNGLFPHAFVTLFSVIPFLFGIKMHFISLLQVQRLRLVVAWSCMKLLQVLFYMFFTTFLHCVSSYVCRQALEV